MSHITAGEIKQRGIGVLDPILREHGEAVVSVRGKSRYVVMTTEAYNRFRENELDHAVRESRADYAAGRISDRTVADHMKRVGREL